jgi:transcriptional regulator with XRE-family HTH domain
MSLGERMEELRAERGWTQREVADKLDVSERTYQLWRSGRGDPYRKNKQKIAEIFGVPVSSLMDESPETMGQLERIEQKLDELLARIDKLPRTLKLHVG